ncbi:hypothetical protein [Sorangium sp. So ce1151]|uniref:hypothetical protein n=1 Tax=Sorangium sp. So ce1151 TaxID=3133332 RepID=UPI003F6238FC
MRILLTIAPDLRYRVCLRAATTSKHHDHGMPERLEAMKLLVPGVESFEHEESQWTVLVPDVECLDRLSTFVQACSPADAPPQWSTPAPLERVTLRSAVEVTGKYIRHLSGPGAYAWLRFLFEPEPSLGDAIALRTAAVPLAHPHALPDEAFRMFLPALCAGLARAARAAPGGAVLSGVSATLLEARFHEVDSRTMAYQHAAALALRQAVVQAGIEPLPQSMQGK